jgi:DNA-binding transcriptional LysR family regulator
MDNSLIDPVRLRCLVTLVEEASVSRAALRLGLSQPAVSHSLRKLRELFKDSLLVRSGGRMLPTPIGLEVASEAREILDRMGRLVEPRQPFDPAIAGKFAMSAPEYVEHLICPAISRLLARQAPLAHLWIRPPDPRNADRMLESGELDVRLGWVRDPAPSTRSRQLYADHFVCLLRRDHPVLREPFSMDQYTGLSHVRAQVATPSTASRYMDEAVNKVGSKLNVSLVVPSYFTIGRVVATTDMVATLPLGIASSLAASLPLSIQPCPLKIPPLKVAMYWHERMQSEARHKWFRNLLIRAATEMADEFGQAHQEH